MVINTASPVLDNIRVRENLIPYLLLTGWEESQETNNRWFVFQFQEETPGETPEIVLPKNSQARDAKIYLENTVNLLSALLEEQHDDVVRRIVYYDTDILQSRNILTGQHNSITLRMAAQQVSELKQLVNFSAFSEYQPKPHFLESTTAIARQMVTHYRFGHTFSGSFGFTILSPIVHLPSPYVQLNLLGESPPDLVPPIERRVMERIVRGLSTTQQAISSRNPQLLIEEYASGFNANMCQAILRMSQDKQNPIEYKVFWSPKVKPTSDVSASQSFELSEPSYEYIEYAANELKRLQPENVKVRGRIVGLSSKDNPLGPNARRSVIIRGRWRENMRPVDIIVELAKDDYIAASEAHIGWAIIEVHGILSRTGSNWRLTEAKDFTIEQA